MEKPAAVLDRVYEWADLDQFVTDPSPGLQIGIVRGRRRHGKSFLLEHLCGATDGLYTLALRQSRAMALARFSDSLAGALGHGVGSFATWAEALDTAVDALMARATGGTPLLVLDEYPYLLADSPELDSTIQALYDRRGPRTGHPPFRLILCGSAVSVMSHLLAGDQALRGRARLDLRIGPFRFRDAAQLWDVEPARAFLIDAVLGGAPGYRDVVGDPPTSAPTGFGRWLSQTILNPSHVLFTEPEHLLAEDPRVGDRAVYHSIWEAVARGATTPTQIGSSVGMDASTLGYHLGLMRDGGYLRYDQDLLLQRKPVITVADPTVRFHHLIVRPNLIDLEARRAEAVWKRSRETFETQILGPHFEHLAREWVTWHGDETGIDDIGHVGQTTVSCPAHRGHQIDVVALSRSATQRSRAGRIVLLGEAKLTRTGAVSQLDRLEHIREVLQTRGWDASQARLAVFAREGSSLPGPDQDGAATPVRADALLVDIDRMYQAAEA